MGSRLRCSRAPGPDGQSCRLHAAAGVRQALSSARGRRVPALGTLLCFSSSVLSTWESKEQHSPFRAGVGTRAGVLQVGPTGRRTDSGCVPLPLSTSQSATAWNIPALLVAGLIVTVTGKCKATSALRS